MNEVIKCLETRRSIRKYKSEQIKKEELDIILEAATWTPTGRGLQSPKIVVVQDPETVALLSALNLKALGSPMAEDRKTRGKDDPFYGAPTVLIVFANRNVTTSIEDASLVLGTIMNAAFSIDVDSCWIHRAKEVFEMPEGKALKEKWGLGDEYYGVGHCILGYRDCELPKPKDRKKDYIIYDK